MERTVEENSALSTAMQFIINSASSLLSSAIDSLHDDSSLNSWFSHQFGADNVVSCIQKFVSEANTSVLCVEIIASPTTGDTPALKVSNDFEASANSIGGVCFRKLFESLTEDVAMCQQINVLSFTGLNGTSFQQEPSSLVGASLQANTKQLLSVLHSLTRHEQLSSSDTDTESKSRASYGSDLFSFTVKLKELESALEHLQYQGNVKSAVIQVPDIVSIASKRLSDELVSALRNASQGRYQLSEVNSADISTESKLIIDDRFISEVNHSMKRNLSELASLHLLIDTSRPLGATITSEISHWSYLLAALVKARSDFDSPSVLLAMHVMRSVRRVTESILTTAIQQIDKDIDATSECVEFLKDYPIHLVSASSSLDQLSEASRSCVSLISVRIRQFPGYSVPRVVKLVLMTRSVIMSQCISLLRPVNLMTCGSLLSIIKQYHDLYSCYNREIRLLVEVLLPIFKRAVKSSSDSSYSIVTAILDKSDVLTDRLKMIADFRHAHDTLCHVIETSLSHDEYSKRACLADLTAALNAIALMNVLDLNDDAWTGAVNSYDRQVERVEDRLAAIVDSAVSMAQTSDDLFAVFAQFNLIFDKPKIRSIVINRQAELLSLIRSDVILLTTVFRKQYNKTSACQYSLIRRVPPLTGRVIWAKQIGQQVALAEKKVEIVLGSSWRSDSEGKKMLELIDVIKTSIGTDGIQQEWLDEWKVHLTRSQVDDDQSLLVVKHDKESSKSYLQVNFDVNIIILVKETRYLEAYGICKRSQLATLISECERRCGFAVEMIHAIKSFDDMMRSTSGHLRLLLSDSIKRICDVISSSFGQYRLRWASSDRNLSAWTMDLSKSVLDMEDKRDDIIGKTDAVSRLLSVLTSCSIHQASEIVSQLQLMIDSIKACNGLDAYVTAIDGRVEAILKQILMSALDGFIVNISSSDHSSSSSFMCEVVLIDQTLSLSPSLSSCKQYWFHQLTRTISLVCSIPRLVSSHYHVFDDSRGKTTYSQIYCQVLPCLVSALESIDSALSQVMMYVDQWFVYQSLWDFDFTIMDEMIGNDMSKWFDLLNEMRLGRTRLDSPDDVKMFGIVCIDFKHTRDKIGLRYDVWQKEVMSRLSIMLSSSISDAFSNLTRDKTSLEGCLFDGAMDDVISSIYSIQLCNKRYLQLSDDILIMSQAEALLIKLRVKFAIGWIQVVRLEGVLSDVGKLLQKQQKVVNGKLAGLQVRILEEERKLLKKMDDIGDRWSKEKPLVGSIKPADALSCVDSFNSLTCSLNDDMERLTLAKSALGIESVVHDPLKYVCMEVEDLKQVWLAMLPLTRDVEIVKQVKWKSFNHTSFKAAIDEIDGKCRCLPLKIKAYEACLYLMDVLVQILSLHSLLRDLKSDSVKDRHWKVLLNKLAISSNLDDLILGHVLNADLNSNRKFIEDVLATAQGEAALEEFLRQTRDYWSTCEFVISLKDGFHCVSSWSDLMNKLDEYLNLLSSIKHSPYYRSIQEFQDETVTWEDKLTRLRCLLQLWVEVQKNVIYLRGIFNGGDIKLQLATQFTKCKAVEMEYAGFMKRTHSRPLVIEAIGVSGLSRLFERLDAAMGQLRRDLGDYLENQRIAFPRFYFVGNDDLIEIVGNSSQPNKVIPHLSKMFAGLSGLQIESIGDECFAVAAISKEGEMINLVDRTVIVRKDLQTKDWILSIDKCLKKSVKQDLIIALSQLSDVQPLATDVLMNWVTNHAVQTSILSLQIQWTRQVEKALNSSSVKNVIDWISGFLINLSDCVCGNISPLFRRKIENLVTEVIYQRDISVGLETAKLTNLSYEWVRLLRFYMSNDGDVRAHMANSSFPYGFEYLGVGERLVQTPLTDRCYLTLTQAIHFRLGGSPFGPAGTGKTESVKMLGAQLGRLVLVFNCDEAFDYSSMGRLFSGLCQVGAWGCFDEFNRLEERILSSVSQQILTIQKGLMDKAESICLLGSMAQLNPDVGIFITMNPGYAGRKNLPENLKGLFRAVTMSSPDKLVIAQVMLFSQGLLFANSLASKIVLLFSLFQEQLSPQSHYDFGLRALKSVLISAGELKRKYIKTSTSDLESKHDDDNNNESVEHCVLVRSVCDTVLPKLVPDDVPLFESLLTCAFPNCSTKIVREAKFVQALGNWCESNCYIGGDLWIDKVLQLKQVLDVRHGVILVGPAGSGKTTVWKSLIACLDVSDNAPSDVLVIDPKAISKDELFGHLDSNTLDWADGIFTLRLRKMIENDEDDKLNNRPQKRHWIVFDGDVDPEWVENLNSVLDDNKILTLPTGDRLRLPESSRIVMEVDSLKYATMATISRCGMVWFSDGIVSSEMMICQLFLSLKQLNMRDRKSKNVSCDEFLNAISHFFSVSDSSSSFVGSSLAEAIKGKSIMNVPKSCYFNSLKSFLESAIRSIDEFEFTFGKALHSSDIVTFAKRWFYFSLFWAFMTPCDLKSKLSFSAYLLSHIVEDFPSDMHMFDVFPSLSQGCWCSWRSKVETIGIDPSKVSSTDVIVPTTDTVRNSFVIKQWLSNKSSFVLCGPPGCGKTMTLLNLLQSMTDQFVPVFVSFSSGSKPEMIFTTLKQYCETVETPYGLVMRPNKGYSSNHWVSLFCDEINLPENDKYGTQKINMLVRQLISQGGFWSPEHSFRWVILERILFVGACNPSSDVGRVPISDRLMAHLPVLFVDFPGEESLNQIYDTLITAMVRLHPSVRQLHSSLTLAMIEVYLKNQEHFSNQTHAHYVYSPRELSRWVRGMHEAICGAEDVREFDLLRLWAHEGERLFCDRLVSLDERKWCETTIREVAQRQFHLTDLSCLQGPILFTHWISRRYQSVDLPAMKEFVKARLKQFSDEVLDLPLVLFDDVLKHVLRINHVLRNPLGHLLLVGDSGVGKTVLTKFVSWMNNLEVFQIKASRQYTIDQFDDDLRSLLRRVGVNNNFICFLFDESNVLSSSFIERMNSLLSLGDIPGLFSGEDLRSLLVSIRESVATERNNLTKGTRSNLDVSSVDIDSDDSLYRFFVSRVQRNLHVVFTMNPASTDFNNRCCTSPALFNRCVIDWFGGWDDLAMTQVAVEYTRFIDTSFSRSSFFEEDKTSKSGAMSVQKCLVASLVDIHKHTVTVCDRIRNDKNTLQLQHYLSPRDFLDFIQRFCATEQLTRRKLEEQQLHIGRGLSRLIETQDQVSTMRNSLSEKEARLKKKSVEANEKLNLMIERQNVAEKRRAEAMELTVELLRQNSEIGSRISLVERQLSEAEPALASARQSVQGIRRIHLDEVRTLARPPNAVKLTLEAISVMLGEKTTEWTELRKFLRRDDFISTVVNFDPASLSQKQIKAITDDYLSNGEFDFETVSHASKACGPLCQWVISQISYSNILKNVEPLRSEVSRLQSIETELRDRKGNLELETSELEKTISKYKSEYAIMILDMENIKNEVNHVLKTINRAESLLQSLGSEKERWGESLSSFEQHRGKLIGDCIIMSAYMSYAGAFDNLNRKSLMVDWCDIVKALNISSNNDLDLTEFMTSPGQRLQWKSEGLADDSLCIENAILLEYRQRFCLLVDPSGLSTQFLASRFANKNVQQTSFLDDQCVKILTSCIRFGTPLIINDAEHADPIINTILNREVQRNGGRYVIRIGREDVDYSPKFSVTLITRNPHARLSPDLCSRASIINFSVTESSFQSNCLGMILKYERPDVDKRRTELAKIRSEQTVKVRELEDSLLQAISNAEGNVLNDDSVIRMLETVKKESFELLLEVDNNSRLLLDLKSATETYDAFSIALTKCFFVIQRLSSIASYYQFTLPWFMNILSKVLLNCQNKQMSQLIMFDRFIDELSRRCMRGLLSDDRRVLSFLLAQIACQFRNSFSESSKISWTDDESTLFLKGNLLASFSSDKISRAKSVLLALGVEFESKTMEMINLSLLPKFRDIVDMICKNTDNWKIFLSSASPEDCFPLRLLDIAGENVVLALFYQVLLIRLFRPDRVFIVCDRFVTHVFGRNIAIPEFESFSQVCASDVNSQTPVMLCSDVGLDPGLIVDDYAESIERPIASIAIGSVESLENAERVISDNCASGGLVLIKNVHLCSEWLTTLEKKFSHWKKKDSFRLFITSEISSSLPSSWVKSCLLLMYECSSGIRSDMERILITIPQTRMDRHPVERSKLYLMLIWFHAQCQERLAYAPLGWTKRYEFRDVDAICSLDMIDEWIDGIHGGRSHIHAEEIPWLAIQSMLIDSLYGSKIDNRYDLLALRAMVMRLFCADAMDSDSFCLVTSNKFKLNLPSDCSHRHAMTWIESLPSVGKSSEWLDLPPSADQDLLGRQARNLFEKLSVLMDLDHLDRSESKSQSNIDLDRSIVMFADKWRNALSSLPRLQSNLTSTSLDRVIKREIRSIFDVISQITSDLSEVMLYSRDSQSRLLESQLANQIVPKKWKSLLPVGIDNPETFLSNVLNRYQSLLLSIKSASPLRLWLGCLMFPEALVTATREHAVKLSNMSLDDLCIQVSLANSNFASSGWSCVILEGFDVIGAQWDSNSCCLEPSQSLSNPVSGVRLEWIDKKDCCSQADDSWIQLPVYTNEDRIKIILEVSIPLGMNVSKKSMQEKGVAIIATGFRAAELN